MASEPPTGPRRRELVGVTLPSGERSQAIRIMGTKNMGTQGTTTGGVCRSDRKGLVSATTDLGSDATLTPVLDNKPVPVVTFDGGEDETLWHVGTLEQGDKHSQFSGSYEGAGLSVSRHPEEWRGIAGLPGSDWQCDLGDNRFLDRWQLSKGQERAVENWAIEAGLLEPVTRWEVRWHDDELGRDVSIHCDSYDEALTEADDDPQAITETRALAVTPRLSSFTGTPAGDTASAFDLSLTAYAEAETDFDGVWWEDDYDPVALSCPRGVILPSRLENWTFTRVDDVTGGEA